MDDLPPIRGIGSTGQKTRRSTSPTTIQQISIQWPWGHKRIVHGFHSKPPNRETGSAVPTRQP